MLNVNNLNTVYSVSEGNTTSDGNKTYQALIIIHLESPNQTVHIYLPILNGLGLVSQRVSQLTGVLQRWVFPLLVQRTL